MKSAYFAQPLRAESGQCDGDLACRNADSTNDLTNQNKAHLLFVKKHTRFDAFQDQLQDMPDEAKKVWWLGNSFETDKRNMKKGLEERLPKGGSQQERSVALSNRLEQLRIGANGVVDMSDMDSTCDSAVSAQSAIKNPLGAQDMSDKAKT